MSLIATGGYGPIAIGMLRVNVVSGPVPRFEVAAGAIDGANKMFLTSSKYIAGTTAVFLNGQLLRADYENGWTETDPDAGRFDMHEAPLAGDVIQVFFLDAAYIGNTANIVTPIYGRIHDIDAITATLDDIDLKTAQLHDQVSICATLNEDTHDILGHTEEIEPLLGIVEICECP